MTLPTINVPHYNFTIPSTGNTIRYRPFLVKEQKVLLMALEGKDDTEITQAVKDVIKSCIIGDIDVEDFTSFDLELFFLFLRAKSMGEVIEASFKCQRQVLDANGNSQICNGIMDISYNVMETKVELPPKEIKNIKITDTIGMMMKYPTLRTMGTMPVGTSGMPREVALVYDMIVKCVDYVYEGETIYPRSSITDQELTGFIENLSQEQFSNIEKFFEAVPAVKKEFEKECPKCKHQHKIVLEGLQSFFG